MALTLQEAASEMHPEWQGGFKYIKNQFKGHFNPNFSHKIFGDKNNLNFFSEN